MMGRAKVGGVGARDNRESILLRVEPSVAALIREAARREERTLTAVVTRALRSYLKTEHGPAAVDEYCNSAG